MQLELKAIQHDVGITFIHVTHDQEEAMTMADQIAVMNQGRIEQLGTPTELYETPATAYVAGFLGASNLIAGTVSGANTVQLRRGPEVQVSRDSLNGRLGEVSVGIRPEKIEFGNGQPNVLEGTIVEQAYVGWRRSTSSTLPVAVSPSIGRMRRPGCNGAAPGGQTHAQLEPRLHVRRRLNGGTRMTDALSRRELMRRAIAGSTLLTVPGILAACGGSSSSSSESPRRTRRLRRRCASRTGRTTWTRTTRRTRIRRSRVPEEVRRSRAVHRGHQRQRVVLRQDPGPLSRGQSIDRDIVVLTDNDRYLALMIKKGWAEKLDKSAIPNFKNLIPVQQHPSFDPDREYSLPWQSGMTGIAYDDKLSDAGLSIKDLLTNPKLKGKITVLNSMGDAMTIVMLANGDDPTKVTDVVEQAPSDRIKKAVHSKQIRQFTGQRLCAAAREGRPRRGDVVVRAISRSSATATSTGMCPTDGARSGRTTC